MKRAFEELSEDEWENHSFDLSRVLKGGHHVKDHRNECSMNGKALPSIESFAFQPKKTDQLLVSLDEAQSSEDGAFELGKNRINGNRRKALPLSPPKPQTLDDDDFELSENKLNINNRSRRLVVLDDSDDDCNEGAVAAGNASQLEVVEISPSVSDDSEGDDTVDIVGNALQKCDKISASLCRELYGSSSVPSTSSEVYSEVEDCAAKIVTQADINVACAAEDSSFQPILKPYQLVGVNFLLLLYRKNIGGESVQAKTRTTRPSPTLSGSATLVHSCHC